MSRSNIAVALVHHPIINRKGRSGSTAITPIDLHDFARTCAFYNVDPIWIVHPAAGMQSLVTDITDYYLHGDGGVRNPDRKQVLKSIRSAASLAEIVRQEGYQLWYTSATPPVENPIDPCKLSKTEGNHLIVLGTGSGLDWRNMPEANGWLSPIEGVGKVRHLSVRAALAIYLDRLRR